MTIIYNIFFSAQKSTDPSRENVPLKDTHSVSQEDKFAYEEGKPCTDKKKIKFSSYIRKLRLDQLQSHI